MTRYFREKAVSERYTRPDWRLVIVILALAGCASEPNPLTPYVGKDVQTIVGRLGYPTSSREMLGHKIYTWNTGSPNGFYCVLDVAIDSSGHIKTINTEGNNGGCDALDERL
jgi:hypothetical protein